MSTPIPVINVNPAPCTCQRSMLISGVPHHAKDCAGIPVLIPCPIPRSVTFTVVLGECTCGGPFPRNFGATLLHANMCPARPIRVTCSISGGTWPETRVSDAERADGLGQPNFTEAEHMRTVALCDDLWALVKALVLGQRQFLASEASKDLEAQRDAVFLALADMARAEEAVASAKRAFFGALHGHDAIVRTDFQSHRLMNAYVERLIEQVGALP